MRLKTFLVFREILNRLESLDGKFVKMETRIIKTLTEFNELIAAMNTATNAVAAKLEELRAQLATAGLDATAEAAIFTMLDTQVTKLKAIGADPVDPIPVDPPQVG